MRIRPLRYGLGRLLQLAEVFGRVGLFVDPFGHLCRKLQSSLDPRVIAYLPSLMFGLSEVGMPYDLRGAFRVDVIIVASAPVLSELARGDREGHRFEAMLAFGVLLLQVPQNIEGFVPAEKRGGCALGLLFLRRHLFGVERSLLWGAAYLPGYGQAVKSPRTAVTLESVGKGGHLEESLGGFCRVVGRCFDWSIHRIMCLSALIGGKIPG